MRIFGVKSRNFTKSTYSKLVVSYLLLVILITFFLSGVLYYMFFNTTMKVIRQNTKESLGQNINHLNLIRNRSTALGLELIKDSEVVKVLYNDIITEDDKYAVVRKFDRIILSDSIIHSIYLYNSKAKTLIGTINNYNDNYDYYMMKLIKESKSSYSPSDFIPGKITYQNSSADIVNENIISIVFHDMDINNLDSNEFNSSIVINLRADYIQKSISSLSSTELSNMIVVNKKGVVVFDSLLSEFGSNISNQRFVEKIMSSKESEGEKVEYVNNNKSLVVFKTYNVTSWVFINVVPYKSLFGEFYALRTAIIILCTVLILVGIISSLKTAKKIYLPFDKLLKNVKYEIQNQNEGNDLNDVQYLSQTFKNIMSKTNLLEDSIKENQQVMKNLYLKTLVTGNMNFYSHPLEKCKELFENICVNNTSDLLSIVVLRVDYVDAGKNDKKIKNISVIKFMLEETIPQLLNNKYFYELIEGENSNICIVIRIKDTDQLNSEVKEIVKRLQGNLQNLFGICITGSLGNPVKAIEDIHLSYSHAVEMMKYTFIYGYGMLFSSETKLSDNNKPHLSLDKYREKLLQGIRSSDKTQTDAQIEKIFSEIINCSYDYMMLIINQLMLDIINAVQVLIEEDNEDFDFNNTYSNLNKIGTLEEMKDFFIMYCSGIIERLERKKNNRKNSMMQQIIKYLEVNYALSDITTERLAEMVSLTPGYFGKLFYKNTGKTINEYLMQIRLNKSRELLLSTNYTVSDIAAKVGFNNATYFNQLFKKSFGITPNNYRLENKDVNNNN